MSIRSPVPGRVSALSISSEVWRKRIIAKTIVAPPSAIRSNPAILPTSCPPMDGRRVASDLLANSKNRSNFSTKNPKAIIAMEVRTHARNVRSFAAWSVYRSIIVAFLIPLSLHQSKSYHHQIDEATQMKDLKRENVWLRRSGHQCNLSHHRNSHSRIPDPARKAHGLAICGCQAP